MDTYLFKFCDPVASFRKGSKGRRSRKIHGSWGESKLGSDAWTVGLRAYEQVSAACGREASMADLKDFVDGTRPLLEDFGKWLEEASCSGKILLVNPVTDKPRKKPLQWKAGGWTWQMRTMLTCMVEICTVNAAREIAEGLGPYFAIAALGELDEAALASLDNATEDVLESVTHARWLMDQVNAASRIEEAAKAMLVKLDSQRASNRAKERHARDPRRRARNFVHECWLAWQTEPRQYPSAAAFARAMLDKEPDTLTSEVVVTRWVREWTKGKD